MWNKFVIACFYHFFQIWARLFPARPIALKRAVFKKILVFSAAGIGDTLTDSVAIGAIKGTFPLARVAVVVHARRAVLIEHNPMVDEIFRYRKSPFCFFSLLGKLRRFHPDVIVMLRGNDPDLWPLAYLVNRDAIVSCPVMTRFKFLISHPVELPDWDRTHGVEQTLEIARVLGAHTEDKRLIYRVTDAEAEAVFEKCRGMGLDLRRTVVFQLGGGLRSLWRDWPAAYYAELGNRLLSRYEAQLALTGGPEHRPKEREVTAAMSQPAFSMIDRLNLSEVAAMLTWAPILVSTDTGVMHIGFAVCRNVLALIHCNNPISRVGPYGYGDQHQVAQLEPPPGTPVSTSVSMSLLTPDQVWPKLEQLCERNGFKRR